MGLLSEGYSDAEQEQFDLGYKHGMEGPDFRATLLEIENMIDASGVDYVTLTKRSPFTARRLGHRVTDEDVQRYEEKLDHICQEWAFWDGARSALKDRLYSAAVRDYAPAI